MIDNYLASMQFLTLQVRDWHLSSVLGCPPQLLSLILLGENQYSSMVGLKKCMCPTM